MKMTDVARYAAEKHMIPNAPINASRSIEISALQQEVWRILTEVSAWQRWYPHLGEGRE